MIGWLGLLLARLAGHLMPPARRTWGHAMEAEARHLSGRTSLFFGLSCLRSGFSERLRHQESQTHFMLWSIVLLSAGLASLQLVFAGNGFAVVRGATDPYLNWLLRGDEQQRQIASAYQRLTPFIAMLLAATGIAQLASVGFLVSRLRTAFLLSSLAALACCTSTGVVIAASGAMTAGLPVQFSVLVLQAMSVPLLRRLRFSR